MRFRAMALVAAMMPLSITAAAAQYNPYPDKPVRFEQFYEDGNGNVVGAEYLYCDGTHSFSGQYTMYSHHMTYDCPEG